MEDPPNGRERGGGNIREEGRCRLVPVLLARGLVLLATACGADEAVVAAEVGSGLKLSLPSSASSSSSSSSSSTSIPRFVAPFPPILAIVFPFQLARLDSLLDPL